jgi:uncharacterized protein YuzE|tara:strand:- start:21743 stop:21985 length:243 start_codon:yes stop_codon:yes gene_type:complete
MKGNFDIYYDPEGDFFEITIMPPPKQSFCEDINEDVFLRKDSYTDEVVGIGILNFKKHAHKLKEILTTVPLKINFEMIEK